MEFREENGVYKIGGYINVVERGSKVIKSKEGKAFVEVVKSGVFSDALQEAKSENREIPLMYRHKEIITKNVDLKEDSIGLKFEAEVDESTYKMVQEENLQCSFGFTKVKDSIRAITNNLYQRTLEKIKLFEVTLTPTPCYSGSLVECRENEDNVSLENLLELREEIEKQIEGKVNEKDIEEERDLKPEDIETIVNAVVAKLTPQEPVKEEVVEEFIKSDSNGKNELKLDTLKMQLELLKLKDS